MYNGFAKQNVMLVLDESAALTLTLLYENGLQLAVGIIIEAFNKATTDGRVQTIFIIPVAEPPQNYTHNQYLVVCSLGENRFYVHLII